MQSRSYNEAVNPYCQCLQVSMQRKSGGSEPQGYLGVKDENVIRNDIAQFTRSEHPVSILRHLVVVKSQSDWHGACMNRVNCIFPYMTSVFQKIAECIKEDISGYCKNCPFLSEKPSDTTAKMQFTTGFLSLLSLTPLALASPIRTCVNELQTFQAQVSPADTSAMVSVHLISYSIRKCELHSLTRVCLFNQASGQPHANAYGTVHSISCSVMTAYCTAAVVRIGRASYLYRLRILRF